MAVDVLEWRDVECESPISLTLVQALQSGEKMDLTVQKAVELRGLAYRSGDLPAQCGAPGR